MVARQQPALRLSRYVLAHLLAVAEAIPAAVAAHLYLDLEQLGAAAAGQMAQEEGPTTLR